MTDDELQEWHDRFYMEHGPCCAGCDWWRSFNSHIGECTASAPVGEWERLGMLGIEWTSRMPSAGHVWTRMDHYCGDFKDEFDWSSLPVGYRVRIGDRSLETP